MGRTLKKFQVDREKIRHVQFIIRVIDSILDIRNTNSFTYVYIRNDGPHKETEFIEAMVHIKKSKKHCLDCSFSSNLQNRFILLC